MGAAAPLWQQVIDWLREEHGLVVYIKPLHEIYPEKKFLGYTTSFTENDCFEFFFVAREKAVLKALESIN
jgi:hypothetical protein